MNLFWINDVFTLPWFHGCDKHCTKQSQNGYAAYSYGGNFVVIFCPCHCFSLQSSDQDIPVVESVGENSPLLSLRIAFYDTEIFRLDLGFSRLLLRSKETKRNSAPLKNRISTNSQRNFTNLFLKKKKKKKKKYHNSYWQYNNILVLDLCKIQT